VAQVKNAHTTPTLLFRTNISFTKQKWTMMENNSSAGDVFGLWWRNCEFCEVDVLLKV
jgi:hypothetical protein